VFFSFLRRFSVMLRPRLNWRFIHWVLSWVCSSSFIFLLFFRTYCLFLWSLSILRSYCWSILLCSLLDDLELFRFKFFFITFKILALNTVSSILLHWRCIRTNSLWCAIIKSISLFPYHNIIKIIFIFSSCFSRDSLSFFVSIFEYFHFLLDEILICTLDWIPQMFLCSNHFSKLFLLSKKETLPLFFRI